MEKDGDELTVGELAERTGLTVRTLHHYDEIGILSPARRTSAGYRIYGTAEIERLHRIVSLRQLGFSLEEIAECLSRPEYALPRLLRLQLRRLDRRMKETARLREKLQRLVDAVEAFEDVPVEGFIDSIEAITMYEKHYTPEQLEKLDERRKFVGEERIREVEAEWPKLIAEVRDEMEKGTDPAHSRVQALVKRWNGLVEEFSGGDPGLERAAGRVLREGLEQPAMRRRTGLDPEVMAYVARARES